MFLLYDEQVCEEMNCSWRLEERSYPVNSLCYDLLHWQSSRLDFQLEIQKLNYQGEKSHHFLGKVEKTWIKKYNGIFTKSVTWLQFQSRSIIGYYHLPTSTRPTQRISIFILYGGLLYDRIFCMWWWDWTIEHVYIFGPQTSSWFQSLTMQPRHCEYCAGGTYSYPHQHLPWC